jgi:hypothetical protein
MGEAILCETCLALILREWKIRQEEFGQLHHDQRELDALRAMPAPSFVV